MVVRHETATSQRLLACFGMLPILPIATFCLTSESHTSRRPAVAVKRISLPVLWLTAVARILRQYDNPFARAWYTGPLDSRGYSLADSARRHTQLLRPDGHIWQIRAAATMRQPVQLTLYDEVFPFALASRRKCFSPPALHLR